MENWAKLLGRSVVQSFIVLLAFVAVFAESLLAKEELTPAPELLFAISGSWELKEADESSQAQLPSSQEAIGVYFDSETKAEVRLSQMKSKFDKLELSVFQYETIQLDGCFFIENYPLSMGAMDLTVVSNERHRILPVCWNGEKWTWSLIEFLEGEDSQIFMAQYVSPNAPNFPEFERARNLLTNHLGLCRATNVKSCYDRIRSREIKIQSKGEALSQTHPRFYSVIRSRAEAVREPVGGESSRFVFSEHKIDSCHYLEDGDDLLKRIQQVAFYERPQSADRECGFMVSHNKPQYVCQPTKEGGLRTQYTFYSRKEACDQDREASLQALSGTLPQPRTTGHTSPARNQLKGHFKPVLILVR